MIPNPSVLNEDVSEEIQEKYQGLSYTSIKQLLSPPYQNNQLISSREKTKSDGLGLIDSRAAEEYLLKVVQNNDINEITNLLNEAENVMIHQIHDSKKYTLLHLAAYNNNLDNLKVLIDHVRKQYKHKAKQILYEWVNRQTEDGFAAFHFAAYRGNIEIIQYLEKSGANLFLLNSQGMNGLHLAAQGDQPKSIVYFKKLGFDFSQKDSKGGTAIHWAAYYGCEQALSYLLSFAVNLIDNQDAEGLTALHLAAMSGNARIVKKLILKGANKIIKNNKNQLAQDIAKENAFKQIYKMLTQSENALLQYFNISQGMRQINRSRDKLYKFIFMLVVCSGVSSYLLYYSFEFILYSIFESVILVLFILLWISDAGIIKQIQVKQEILLEKHQKLYQMLNIYDANEICADCVVIKMPRSKHCDICQKCILVYDHHCPWIDNCIGCGNHFIFYIFVILVLIDANLSLILQIYKLSEEFEDLLYNQWIEFSILLISIIILIMFYFPIWFLFIVQSKNLLIGKTTYERYSNSQNNKRISAELITYNLSNCIDMCFRNKQIRYTNIHPNKQSLQLYNPLKISD